MVSEGKPLVHKASKLQAVSSQRVIAAGKCLTKLVFWQTPISRKFHEDTENISYPLNLNAEAKTRDDESGYLPFQTATCN